MDSPDKPGNDDGGIYARASGSRHKTFVAILVLCLLLSAGAQAAQTAAPVREQVTVRLTAAVDHAGAAATIQAGLEIALDPGWHTYWRNPGESGAAPRFDWSRSVNVKDIVFRWPLPQRFATQDLSTFGYERAVLFPLSLSVEKTGEPVTLALDLNIVICEEVCIPKNFTLSLDLPAGMAKQTPEASAISAAFDELPAQADGPGLKIESAVAGPAALVVRAYSAQRYENADLFVETPPDSVIVTAKPEITPDEKDPRYATLRIPAPQGTDNLAAALMGKKVTLTLVAPGGALEKEISF